MRFERLFSVVCLVLPLPCALVNASPPLVSDLPPHFIIDRLKEVRQGWAEVEIEYVQFERFSFDRPRTESRMIEGGRFVLVLLDCGELETFLVNEAGHRKGNETRDHFVWTAGEFRMHWPDGHVAAVSRSDLGKRGGQLWARPSEAETGKQKPTFLQWLVMAIFSKWEFAPPRIAESPKDCLPLVFAESVESLSERFELSITENDQHFFLVARPKKLEDRRSFRKTAICVERETFLPVAKQTVLPTGNSSVWVLVSLRVNGEEMASPLSRTEESDQEDEVAATR